MVAPSEIPAEGGGGTQAHVRAHPRRPCCRARHPCVRCPVFHSGVRRRQGLPARRPRRGRDQARSPDQDRRRPGGEAARAIAPRGRCRVPAQRLPRRHGAARPDRRGRARRQRELAAARARHPADPRRPTTASARRCSSAPRPPPTSPISAPAIAARRPTRSCILGRTFGDRQLWRPALDALRLSLDLREVADVRALYEQLREDHGFRLLDYSVDADAASPRACFQFSEELPGKRTDFSPFVAVAGHRQARAVGRGQAALRRGPEARRALQRHAARRPAVDRAARRCRSPPTSRSMCATASRSCASPARPMCCRAPASAASRWSASTPRRSTVADLSHRRPQPDRHGARPRLPAQSRPLRRRAADREPRHQGVERRARGRADAQRRRHHRVPGRSGGRRSRARRLCDDRRAQGHGRRRLRLARDAMVHRLRSRPHRLFRQRRHQRLRQFARHHRAEGRRSRCG